MKKPMVLWIVLLGIVFDTRAFVVENVSSAPSIETPTAFTAARYDFAKELQDPGDLTPFPDPPFYTTLLEVYSEPYGTKLMIDARPMSSITPIVLSLKLRGKTVAQADNHLNFQVDSIVGFEHRLIQARQVWPSAGPVYTIPKDGSIYSIQLPNLVNQSAGVYATWMVTVERILPGDIFEDGKVDLQDFARLAAEWMTTSSQSQNGGNYLASDTDLSRLINLQDLITIVDSWLMEY